MSGEPGTAGNGRKSLVKIKDEVVFFPHQLTGVRDLARKTSFLLADEMGGGKAQPVGTPVATPDGWRPIGALLPGDVICRPSGGTQRVLQRHPQGVIDVARVGFSDGSQTLASWDHLWAVSDADDPACGWYNQTTLELHTQGLEAAQGGPKWEIPLARPLEGWGDPLPEALDPFTLGFALAGGFSFRGRRIAKNELRITWGRYEVAKTLRMDNCKLNAAYGEPCMVVPSESHPDALGDFLYLLASFGANALVAKRHIPDEIQFAPAATRMRILLGALAAAGDVNANGQGRIGMQFPTSRVAGDFKRLINNLGGLAIVDQQSHRLTFWWPTPIRLWSGTVIRSPLPVREITGISPAGRADSVCITVDDPEGLYVTEHAIVTHNSLQSLTVAAIDYEMGTAKRTLIVCPATLKDNWASEIEEFTNFRPLVCQGTKPQRVKQLAGFRTNNDHDILIVNYEQVIGHLEDLNACNIDILIFDEAHYLKNPKSKRTKACHKIAAKRSFLLTGSPMLNQPQELWGILHRINPKEFPSFWKFSQRHCAFGGFQAKQVVGVKNKVELLEILDRYMLRRLKKDMLNLPPKNFIQVRVPLSPLQARLYREAETELRLTIPGEPEPLELENALTKILRLKQITGTPATLGFEDSSIKLDAVIERTQLLIDEGEKVVIFTQFRGVLAAIEERLNKAKIPVWTLTGDVPNAKRIPTVHEWRDSKDIGVMLSMFQVGGVGVDFTAASNMILVDKLYVPDLNNQAVDRCHRLSMDKTKPVNIWEFIAVKTVEDRVEKILKRKKKMITEVIDSKEYRKLIVSALHEDE